MKRLMKLSLVLMLCANYTQAQVASGSFGYYQEALLFSRTTPGGTARMQGIGGAQVALGGDISSAYSNPAGLGFFNKSEFTFTPSVNFQDSETDLLNTNTKSFKNKFSFNNMGIVFKNASNEGKFKGGVFGISVNKINEFANEYRYEGVNGNNSIVDSFIESAGSTDTQNLSGFEAVAYEHFLIDLADYGTTTDYLFSSDGIITPNAGDGTYEGYGSPFGNIGGSLPKQEGTVQTSGSQYQWNFSYGANYDDLLYFGAALGVQTINYDRERTYIESNFRLSSDNSVDDLINSIRIDDKLNITGTGVNATFGLIARPTDFLRVGISYVTPTALNLSEESSFDFVTDWNSFYSYGLPNDTVTLETITTQSDLFVSNYSLRTPSRLTTGLAFFLGKHGFISGDVEFVNYGNSQLKSTDFSPTADNRSISNLYTNTVNYRVGGEYRYDMFRLRAGYAYQGDPYVDGSIDRSIQNISGGIGIRVDNYFVDLAFTNTKSDGLYKQYELSNNLEPTANIKNKATNVAVTVGFKF